MTHARGTGRTATTLPWHDWRFELIPRADASETAASMPRGRTSPADGRVGVGGERCDHTPKQDQMPAQGGEPMTTTIRSRKVRRILRLEVQADRQATREARATARATLLQRRVDALRTEARALEASLNGSQRAELGRARAGAILTDPRAPRCPVRHDEAHIPATPQEV
jgi:hypothetical protein